MSNIIQKKINSELKFVYSNNNAISVIFQNNDLLLGVVGEFNCNLKELEKITETNIYSRGNSILIKSNPKKNEIVKNAIQFLSEQFIINGTIEKKDIISSVNQFMIDEKINNNSVVVGLKFKGSKAKLNDAIIEGFCISKNNHSLIWEV